MNDMSANQKLGQVGRSIPRVESHAKVTGTADNSSLSVPACCTRNLRAGFAHARMFISTSTFGAFGRRATVIKARTPPRHSKFVLGPAFHDHRFSRSKRRYVGEPVEVVSLRSAFHRAPAFSKSNTKNLPPVFNEVDAASSKDLVH